MAPSAVLHGAHPANEPTGPPESRRWCSLRGERRFSGQPGSGISRPVRASTIFSGVRLVRAGGTRLPIGVSGRFLSWQTPQHLSSCILRTYLPANCFSAIFSPRQKLCLAADYGGTTQFIEIWIDQSDNLRAVLKAPHRGVVQANRPEKPLARVWHVSVARCGD